jgi:hypothetical protein
MGHSVVCIQYIIYCRQVLFHICGEIKKKKWRMEYYGMNRPWMKRRVDLLSTDHGGEVVRIWKGEGMENNLDSLSLQHKNYIHSKRTEIQMRYT